MKITKRIKIKSRTQFSASLCSPGLNLDLNRALNPLLNRNLPPNLSPGLRFVAAVLSPVTFARQSKIDRTLDRS
jgi:hypothetical protein